MPKNKCSNRGKQCQWLELDDKLVNWIKYQQQCGDIVTCNMTHIKTLAMIDELNITPGIQQLVHMIFVSFRSHQIKKSMTNYKIVFIVFQMFWSRMQNLQVPQIPAKLVTCSFSFISVTSTQQISRLGYQVPQHTTLWTLFIKSFSESWASLVFCLSYKATFYARIHTLLNWVKHLYTCYNIKTSRWNLPWFVHITVVTERKF